MDTGLGRPADDGESSQCTVLGAALIPDNTGGFLVSAVIMMLMFSMVGYQRVLGLAHILWVPLLYFVLREIPVAEGGYKTYLILLAACNGMSLVFDVRDVWLHFCAND